MLCLKSLLKMLLSVQYCNWVTAVIYKVFSIFPLRQWKKLQFVEVYCQFIALSSTRGLRQGEMPHISSYQYCFFLWPCFWRSFGVWASVLPYVSVMLLFYRVNCQQSCALPQKQGVLTSLRTGAYLHHAADQKSQAGCVLFNLVCRHFSFPIDNPAQNWFSKALWSCLLWMSVSCGGGHSVSLIYHPSASHKFESLWFSLYIYIFIEVHVLVTCWI